MIMIRGAILWAGIVAFCIVARDVVGNIPVLVNLKSFLIVLLGTLIGGFLSIPVNALAGFQQSVLNSLKRHESDPKALIEQIVAIARLHRVLDIRELAKRYHRLENPFLRRGLLHLLDQSDRPRIEESMEKEISLYLSRLHANLAAVQHFVRLAPVFGFVGTIIGLINVLNNMGDAAHIGHGMAISLLTTFYGLLVANFLFTPLAGKLAAYIQRETLTLNIVIEGVLAIYDGCLSTEVSHRLLSYVETDAVTQAVASSKPVGMVQKWSSAIKPGGLLR
jgi:chemotaxis protein MotA